MIIALAGNPNVGKSTVFNGLTGLHQHTGNWPGKTVASARGFFDTEHFRCELVDLPGAYSLLAHSAEEEITRDFLLEQKPDAVIVVCDAVCLERNLLLALQICAVCPKVLLCVNLIDEAAKKKITLDLPLLEELVGVPVIGTAARRGQGLNILTERLDAVLGSCEQRNPGQMQICRSASEPAWDSSFRRAQADPAQVYADAAAAVCSRVISFQDADYRRRDRNLDKFLTGKHTSIPIMLLLLVLILWITIAGANYPSQLLSRLFLFLGNGLLLLFDKLHVSPLLSDFVLNGIYQVLTWVISVMLPPMAIFFPLFTLLEDSGFLPRIAFNLDYCFQKCKACGKQALTMAMGFGCNCVGVLGCRIIDSPRERLIAILTNSFVPCNGRFPLLITLATLYFTGSSSASKSGINEALGESAGSVQSPVLEGASGSLTAALCLAGFLFLSVIMTLAASKVLSATVLKGLPSSFLLELPPYRRPQIGKVLVRSLLDRTLFVLKRAASAAIPAGALIWCAANITVDSRSLLSICSEALDPAGRLLGLDGVILLAFLLGMPANEIVIPIMLMTYLAQPGLIQINDPELLKSILSANGWTLQTAVCTCLFSLFHWPCATTLLCIKKESGSLKWTAAAFLLPTLWGTALCMIFAQLL